MQLKTAFFAGRIRTGEIYKILIFKDVKQKQQTKTDWGCFPMRKRQYPFYNDFTISSSDSLEFDSISFSVFIREIRRVSVSVVSFIKSAKQAG